jgi:hypothetical protein
VGRGSILVVVLVVVGGWDQNPSRRGRIRRDLLQILADHIITTQKLHRCNALAGLPECWIAQGIAQGFGIFVRNPRTSLA